MGDPKHPKKKYETAVHPWQKARIVEEKKLKKDYGMVNKKEIWKMGTILKKAKDQVKKLTPLTSVQADKERQQLHKRLVAYGLLKPDQDVGFTLALEIKDVLERRLQTIVVRKGLARSMVQARQFITHGHLMVSGHKTTAPSYLVRVEEEASIQFLPGSQLAAEDHPERKGKDNGVSETKTTTTTK